MKREAELLIVGGGLAGLYAANLLQQRAGCDWMLLEARPSPGGRIQSASLTLPTEAASAGRHRFDLGPSWFWPALQPELGHLVDELGLDTFPQHEQGELLVDRSRAAPPVRTAGYRSAPASLRIHGGTQSLVDALAARAGAGRVQCGTRVTHVRALGGAVEVEAIDAQGRTSTWCARRMLLALPPRLAAATLRFSPALPDSLARQWAGTPTWMAPHAKYVAVYDEPFWRADGLSGEARSGVGPLGEIHDASFPGGGAALFGFFGVPAATRVLAGEEVLRAHCRMQLGRLFGPRAAQPLADWMKDWSSDTLTSTPADLEGDGQHGRPPPATAASGPWAGLLFGIASEWSTAFPGYLAGAIDAAARGVQAALDHQAGALP